MFPGPDDGGRDVSVQPPSASPQAEDASGPVCWQVRGSKLELVRGDITLERMDAIVNAANSELAGGGGVDGAIHRRAGPQLARECTEIRRTQGPCPAGQAVLTSGGELAARWVIHTVGPRWKGGSHGEAEVLRSAYMESLKLADQKKLHSVSFPSVSTGAYGYPVEEAARVALGACRDYLTSGSGIALVRFVLFDDRTYVAYAGALAQLTA